MSIHTLALIQPLCFMGETDGAARLLVSCISRTHDNTKVCSLGRGGASRERPQAPRHAPWLNLRPAKVFGEAGLRKVTRRSSKGSLLPARAICIVTKAHQSCPRVFLIFITCIFYRTPQGQMEASTYDAGMNINVGCPRSPCGSPNSVQIRYVLCLSWRLGENRARHKRC